MNLTQAQIRQTLRSIRSYTGSKDLIDALQALIDTKFLSPVFVQAAPAAKTTSTTLTAAELLGGLITGNQGAAGAATYTLPLATALETALLGVRPDLANDDAFDFNVLNISTVAAEDITIATATGWTLVGNMVIESNEATAQKNHAAAFRVRRTAANAYTLYRIA